MSAATTHFHFPLSMKPESGRLHEPAAWFIAGYDSARWIAEMTTWNVALLDAQLYVLPTSIDNTSPCGVLVVLPSEKISVTSALPYALLGKRLFVPVDATLDPEISSEEIREKLLWPVQVLHLGAGLVGFKAEDAIAIADLIIPPVRRNADWSFAEVGVAPRPPLVSVVGESMPSMQDILDMGRDDIGSESEEELPRLPDESPMRDAMGRAMNAGFKPLLSGLMRLLSYGSSMIPKRPTKPPGKGKPAQPAGPARKPGLFRQWLTRKMQAISRASQEMRNREINRLLGLLQNDPDTGLQFALPLHTIATRGMAPPSNRLGQRSVNFNLSSLFGGNRPGDNWSLPADLREQLTRRYREAANREMNLGRFSRAAYIFAHLLGDFTAAADALKRGKSFREASVIYKDKLNNAKAAADCLTEGGLLLEAIPIYVSLELFEIAGDLHRRLGQEDEARRCYTIAIGNLAAHKNFLAAANLAETKLHDPKQALGILAATWPDSDSAGICLRAWFHLAGTSGEAAGVNPINRIDELRSTPLPTEMLVTLVCAFGAISKSYPNNAVRDLLADSVRVLAGNCLMTANLADRQTLTQAVISLEPADRLLARDGNRYLSSFHIKPASMPIPVKGDSPRRMRSFKLPNPFELFRWRSVVSLPGGFLAFGASGMRCVMVRGDWNGRMNHVINNHETSEAAYSLIAPSHGSRGILASSWPLTEINPRQARLHFELPRIDVYEEELVVEVPAYVDRLFAGICRDESGITWVANYSESAESSLAAYSPTGTLLVTHPAPFAIPQKPVSPLPMVARRGHLYIAVADQLIRYSTDRNWQIPQTMPSPVQSLVPSSAHTVTRMIATFNDGCALVTEDLGYRRLSQGLSNPVATFTPDGSIVVVGQEKGHIHGRKGVEMVFIGDFATDRTPLAVLPAVHGEFALFDPEGNVDIFRLNSI